MTDKQIIIDDVDVSGCLYFCDGYCNDHNGGFKCNLNSEHCYYKQLKRKEQECEELQSHFKQIDESNKILYQEKCELLQQLDQLKVENDLLRKTHKTEQDRRRAYENALAAIKEIIHFNKTNRLSGGACISIEQILQKISECEVENENTAH